MQLWKYGRVDTKMKLSDREEQVFRLAYTQGYFDCMKVVKESVKN